jgi:GxxExxY protein
MEVHDHLGPGLLESIYEECLCDELEHAGIPYTGQHRIPVQYKGRKIDCHFQLDPIVAQKLVLEVKAVAQILPVHDAQLLTYLRLTGLPLGLLLNFNEVRLKDGSRRRRL